MRAATRLFAAVKPQYLEPGAPTGLAGLFTHATPRSTLLYLYSATLDKLKTFPESSVYRQSTEALTKQRLSVIESVTPEGLEAWQNRVSGLVEQYPNAFRKVQTSNGSSFNIIYKDAVSTSSQRGISAAEYNAKSEDQTHNDESKKQRLSSGPKYEDDPEVKRREELIDEDPLPDDVPHIEPEPPLSVDQIGAIENQIGAGLIEEVIQVAEGELKLAGVIGESKAWEDLEEKPQEGQWSYFQRDTHTPQTQAR
ncbi:hypothetical protein K431DRAFT_315865 [Polychaeton citri CBS 116435]|uniref:NADH-ubiquinone oxidoreductase 299 kDa subunit n=1 Tax=Polychaeton citri CBS 116435 TaxID=1314669 RepID=A0A9P4Q0W5_9PEZI|nr:hypothetical protein K431DRAFT_315865 [Polychaeton citri CBS 116435]